VKTLVVLLVTFGLALSSTAFAASSATRASLQITDAAPLTVRGAGFRSGERVKLLVSAGRPLSKTVKAGPSGRFTARFGVRTTRGTAVVIQAIGSRGSRAMVDVTTPSQAATHGSKTDCDELP
jgi:hypothetical protein